MLRSGAACRQADFGLARLRLSLWQDGSQWRHSCRLLRGMLGAKASRLELGVQRPQVQVDGQAYTTAGGPWHQVLARFHELLQRWEASNRAVGW